MKQKLEQVIEDLQDQKANLTKYGHNWNRGWNSAIELAITKLREVIASDDVPTSIRQTSPSGKDDTAQQVQE